jgi:phenylacetate-CoA ligase
MVKITIYHHLPYPLRVAAASAKGYYLRWWRYGPETERLVEEALERESWTSTQWKSWQEERLARLLHRARHHVPYYRSYWDERERRGERSAWQYLENWPILRKEAVRAQPRAFLAEDCNARRMYHDHTSGTTGTPLSLWFSRETLHRWYALFEARLRRWHGVTVHERWGIFGGQRVVPFEQKTPPFWVENYGLNQVYFSVLHIAPWSTEAYLHALQRFQLTHLIVYPSSLYFLAGEALETHRDFPIPSKLRVIFANAEPLYPFQREKIQLVFGCPVRETYGQAERVCTASECEAGRMHVWPEVGYTEILDDEARPVRPGEIGRLIATSLLNTDMPLIRYEVGDMVTNLASSGGEPCACGRYLPQLGNVLGRNDDVIRTRDGRKIVQIDTIYAPEYHVKESQIIQESLDKFRIKVVPAEGWSKENGDALRQALQERVGKVQVEVEIVDSIERTWAGKFRVIISKMPIDSDV